MQDGQEIKKGGLYRQYKRRYYRLIDIAMHTETEENLVIYIGINKETGQAGLFARPLDMWLEKVDDKPRFELVQNENCSEVLNFFNEVSQTL